MMTEHRSPSAPERPNIGGDRSPCDSIELQRLRVNFRHTRPNKRATPARLGAYAAHKQRVITDFGAHSVRWVNQFVRAYKEAKNTTIYSSLDLTAGCATTDGLGELRPRKTAS